MTADLRSLCARFVEAIDLLCGSGDSPARPGERLILTTYVDGLEELAEEARKVLAANSSPVDQCPGYDTALKAFAQYFRRNYPGPHTVIHRPDWHAPRIFRAAAHAIVSRCGRLERVPATSFEQAWATLGYCYGEDALEGVRLGWDLRGRFQLGPATGGLTPWPEAIRDRRPEPEDGDCDGCVQVLDEDGCWECCLQEDVDPGQPWLHTPRWVAQ